MKMSVELAILDIPSKTFSNFSISAHENEKLGLRRLSLAAPSTRSLAREFIFVAPEVLSATGYHLEAAVMGSAKWSKADDLVADAEVPARASSSSCLLSFLLLLRAMRYQGNSLEGISFLARDRTFFREHPVGDSICGGKTSSPHRLRACLMTWS